MTRLTAKDFSPELLQLYDGYAHGRITKREFLDRAGRLAVGGMTAMAVLQAMSPDYALAQQEARHRKEHAAADRQMRHEVQFFGAADPAQHEEAVKEGGDEGAEHDLVAAIAHEVAQDPGAELGRGELEGEHGVENVRPATVIIDPAMTERIALAPSGPTAESQPTSPPSRALSQVPPASRAATSVSFTACSSRSAILKINGLTAITDDVVHAARSTLIIGAT